ncbi:sugar phosphate nucleotidyltransferase [Patescibacteria group bacterium]|nr:sugar phosphate nucleotidyltransferase [Patescibacteria group bacterium]
MSKKIPRNVGAVILAAGKGKRMQAKSVNKVAMNLADKPMIIHAVHLLRKVKIKTLVVVVGFAKDSVLKLLDSTVLYAEQNKRLGTAHAVMCGIKKIPDNITDVLVLNGDDSAFYDTETIEKLICSHFLSDSAFTFLTLEIDDPTGLGRVVRDKDNKVTAVVEEKDATLSQRKIKEVNPACYIFRTDYLKKYLKKVEKSKITGEYYLTSLIGIGIKNNEKIDTLKISSLPWRGVNTRDELIEAERMFLKLKD